jgi:hypothetical protein
LEIAQGDSNTVPAKRAEDRINWRRSSPWFFLREFFMDESFPGMAGDKLLRAAQ